MTTAADDLRRHANNLHNATVAVIATLPDPSPTNDPRITLIVAAAATAGYIHGHADNHKD